MSRKIARFGWLPDLPSHHDRYFKVTAPIALPPSTDLRGGCPPVYDQGQLGSCTANAIAAALEFERMRQGLADFIPSRLFIYYNERMIEGTVDSDSGAMIRDGIQSVANQGACDEMEWGYDISQFAVQPPSGDYTDALADKALQYQRLDNTDLIALKTCLAQGTPFIFGFTVYDSFESDTVAQTGLLDLPTSGEEIVGGHAVLAVGYDDATQRFIVRNSWGDSWGMSGYFTMPYAYLTNIDLADDFWQITLVGS